MARSEDDMPPRNDDSLDAGSPPAGAPPANPGTEPHTTPGLTTDDRRTVDPRAGAGDPPAAGVVYDDRKQRAVDPHRDDSTAGAASEVSVKGVVDQVLDAVEPRPSPTGTMGASGDHARLPERDA